MYLQHDLPLVDLHAVEHEPHEFLALEWLQLLVDRVHVRQRAPNRLRLDDETANAGESDVHLSDGFLDLTPLTGELRELVGQEAASSLRVHAGPLPDHFVRH
ncbi:MAG: hypothetical protein WEB52_05860 [Dehalococcoidia bacterium]